MLKSGQHDLFRISAFEGHKVTPVKQFQPEDFEALLKRQSFCSEKYHEREVTRFFCLECESCVCQVCIVTDHKSHDVVPLDKAADDEKPNILRQATLMKEKEKICRDVIREFDKAALELEANISIAKREVSEVAGRMFAIIQEREREAITALENTRVSRIQRLKTLNGAATKEQMQCLADQANQVAVFANTLVQRSSSSDIVRSKRNLEQRFEELNKTPIPAMHSDNSFVRFVSTCKPNKFSLGFLTTTKTDVLRSTVEGLSKNCKAGLETEFYVCPKAQGHTSADTKHKFHVEVDVEPSEKVASLIICEKGDGNFQVKLTPKVPGTYNIKVKINGNKLANSPSYLHVKERRYDVVGELHLQGEIPQKPRGVAVNSKGLIAIADSESHCILIFGKDGAFLRKLGCHGNTSGQLNSPADITYLNEDELLVADYGNHKIQQFNVQTGNFVKSFGKEGTGDGEFKNPVSVCMDSEGHVVVAEYSNSRIQVLTKDGAPVFKFGDSGSGKLNHPIGCVHHRSLFVVCDSWNHCLKVFGSSGKFLYKIGSRGKADGQLDCPYGLCVDKHGNLLVSDKNNRCIQQFTVEGSFTGKTVIKLLKQPCGITATPDGRILLSDYQANKIYIIK